MDRTPGYWHWHDAFGRKDGKGDPIGTGRGLTGDEPAVGSCSRFSFAVSDDDGFVVARCSNALVTMSKERSEANARLCAGAPEMELMLRRIAEKVLRVTEKHYIGGIVRVEDRNELHGMAREAGELLAKVRG